MSLDRAGLWDRPEGRKRVGIVAVLIGNGLERIEAFLRFDDAMSAGERLRGRVMYGLAGLFLVMQAVNWAVMWRVYGGLNHQHAISLLACAVLVGVAVSLRWTRSRLVTGGVYGAALLGGVCLATLTAQYPLVGGGIHSSLIPLLMTGPMLLAMTSHWKAVIGYACAASAMLVWMSGLSADMLGAAAPALAAVLGYELAAGFRSAQAQTLVQGLVALWVITLIAAPFGATLYALFSKLEAAAEEADRANRAKSDFLATMSHEVRTPLNGIIAMSDLMLRRGLDGAAGQQATIINTASAQLLDIVNDVLDTARLEAGEVRLQAEAFDLRAALDAVVELHRARADDKGLWLGLEWQEGLAERIVGDGARWKQIVGNFLSNAVKFTQSGGVRVGVRGVAAGEGSLRLQVFVQDTGAGIEADAQAAVFERYGQSESGYRQGAGGTGLGLAITRELVELMGGTVSLRSEPGKGSVFAVEVVVALAEAEVGAEAGPKTGLAKAA